MGVPGVDYPSGGAVSKLLPLFRKGASHLDAIFAGRLFAGSGYMECAEPSLRQ